MIYNHSIWYVSLLKDDKCGTRSSIQPLHVLQTFRYSVRHLLIDFQD